MAIARLSRLQQKIFGRRPSYPIQLGVVFGTHVSGYLGTAGTTGATVSRISRIGLLAWQEGGLLLCEEVSAGIRGQVCLAHLALVVAPVLEMDTLSVQTSHKKTSLAPILANQPHVSANPGLLKLDNL